MVTSENKKNVENFENLPDGRPHLPDGDGQPNEPLPVVLIVDDDADNRAMLKILLEMWKSKVIEAADGSEAIKLSETIHPDLILMDVRMPDLSGFEVTQHLRQSAKTAGIPIIFLSGCAEENYKKQASAVGGNEYLVKPIDFQELETTLVKYLFQG
jgi:sigma-B regulation protein RsbU (phosphoserine phosphatase)